MMTPIKDKTPAHARGERKLTSTVETPTPKKPKAPVEKAVDYAEVLDPIAKVPAKKTRGRGPTPHYIGVIRAFIDSGDDERPINIDKFREIVGKPELKRESIRQGFRTTLQDERYEDSNGVLLWDRVRVSIIADPANPQDHEKATITLRKHDSKGNRQD